MVTVLIHLLACATSSRDAVRQAWLVEALVDDNLRWLGRDPAPLETKLARMAEDPYDYVRGTAGVYLLDQARPGTDRAPTTFLVEKDAWSVLLAGDPHPENVGTLLPEDGPGPAEGEGRTPAVLLELVDLDGAGFGPYPVDLRRAELALALIADDGCGPRCAEAAVRAHARGWFDEIARVDAGHPEFRAAVPPDEADPITAGLLDGVLERGPRRQVLDEVTEPTATGRRFRLDEATDEEGRGILRLDPEDRARLDRLLAAYPWPEGARVLDVARRYGVGVASLPAVRYVVAWDRGADGPEDDELLSVREVVDPVALPRVHPEPPGRFDGEADRVAETSRLLWSRPDADPRLAALTDDGVAFKVQAWSSWQETFDHEDVAEDLRSGRRSLEELEAWAETLGRQLGAAHARAPLPDGRPALRALVADLANREEAFVGERTRDALADLATVRRDHALFVDALGELGPLLGADGLEAR